MNGDSQDKLIISYRKFRVKYKISRENRQYVVKNRKPAKVVETVAGLKVIYHVHLQVLICQIKVRGPEWIIYRLDEQYRRINNWNYNRKNHLKAQ